MHRFYADEAISNREMAYLTPEDARHAMRVLRMKAGDAAEIFLLGHRYRAALEDISGERVAFRLTDLLPTTEARLRITLYQGLPKADKMELIVQKAVELGVEAVVPVAMSRCVVQLDARDGQKKQERWQKIAREAGKQSGRCRIPFVSAPLSFQQMLQRLASHQAAIVPWENAAGYGPKQFYQAHEDIRDVAIVIGPEGGMTAEEIAAMEQVGCLQVTLGPRILRTETAGLATISALMCLYDEMNESTE